MLSFLNRGVKVSNEYTEVGVDVLSFCGKDAKSVVDHKKEYNRLRLRLQLILSDYFRKMSTGFGDPREIERRRKAAKLRGKRRGRNNPFSSRLSLDGLDSLPRHGIPRTTKFVPHSGVYSPLLKSPMEAEKILTEEKGLTKREIGICLADIIISDNEKTPKIFIAYGYDVTPHPEDSFVIICEDFVRIVHRKTLTIRFISLNTVKSVYIDDETEKFVMILRVKYPDYASIFFKTKQDSEDFQSSLEYFIRLKREKNLSGLFRLFSIREYSKWREFYSSEPKSPERPLSSASALLTTKALSSYLMYKEGFSSWKIGVFSLKFDVLHLTPDEGKLKTQSWILNENTKVYISEESHLNSVGIEQKGSDILIISFLSGAEKCRWVEALNSARFCQITQKVDKNVVLK